MRSLIAPPLTKQAYKAFMDIVWQDRPSSVNSGDGWKVIVNAQTYIADQMTDKNGQTTEFYQDLVEAYCDLADIQDCLLHGTTQICKHCGDMKGLHYKITGEFHCRIYRDRWSNPLRLIANRFEE